jgi:predicted dienelactone hydrolase
MKRLLIVVLTLFACNKEDEELGPEPLDLPADPAATGVPVGVRTVEWGNDVLEVWYPASDTTEGIGEVVDFGADVPTSVTDLLGDIDIPVVHGIAVRDAPVRIPLDPYPTVIFSHGFGGNRIQSVTFTSHLASRGYVVVSTDHRGRSLADVLPCLFNPPAEGCLIEFNDDPGLRDVPDLVEYLDDAAHHGFLKGAIDTKRMALTGHSAGGGTTVGLSDNERFTALIPMAGGGEVTRDVPVLRMAGECDGVSPASGSAASHALSTADTYLEITGAGHLAFSDLCTIELGRLAEEYLIGRDDLNGTMMDLLVALATDGCPGEAPDPSVCDASEFLDLGVSNPIINHYATVFLDEVLYRSGPGVEMGLFDEAVIYEIK